jgi:serpin B
MNKLASTVAAGLMAAAAAGGEPALPAAAAFGWRLLTEAGRGTGNVFLSPYSIEAAFAMTAAGARGATEEQMADTLGLPRDRAARDAAMKTLRARVEAIRTKGETTLDSANRVWVQQDYKLLAPFVASVRDNYGADLPLADFAGQSEKVRVEINGWVEQKTRDRIKDLVPPGGLGSLTRMVLVNAIYFYGSWETAFDVARTREAPFHRAGGGDVNVPMMRAKFDKARYGETPDAQWLELPYKGGGAAMVLVLPREGRMDAVVADLAGDGWAKGVSGLSAQEVRVALPRFRIESSFGLHEILPRMGMMDAFDVRAADFSGMTGRPDLFISAAFHKAFCEVDEKGTEAAAATAVVMALREAPRAAAFRADRPFLFGIRDRVSGALLFIGRVADPSS